MSRSRPECWACGDPVIQGGDHDIEDEQHSIVSNFHCPSCNSFYLMYWGEPEPNDEDLTPSKH